MWAPSDELKGTNFKDVPKKAYFCLTLGPFELQRLNGLLPKQECL